MLYSRETPPKQKPKEKAMPSFDFVLRTEISEVDNAI